MAHEQTFTIAPHFIEGVPAWGTRLAGRGVGELHVALETTLPIVFQMGEKPTIKFRKNPDCVAFGEEDYEVMDDPRPRSRTTVFLGASPEEIRQLGISLVTIAGDLQRAYDQEEPK